MLLHFQLTKLPGVGGLSWLPAPSRGPEVKDGSPVLAPCPSLPPEGACPLVQDSQARVGRTAKLPRCLSRGVRVQARRGAEGTKPAPYTTPPLPPWSVPIRFPSRDRRKTLCCPENKRGLGDTAETPLPVDCCNHMALWFSRRERRLLRCEHSSLPAVRGVRPPGY